MFSARLLAQADYFQTGYGGAGTEKFTDIEQVSSGGFIASGYSNSFGTGDYDVLVMRLNVNGDQMWTKTAGSAGDDFANCMTILSDGTVVIAGSTSGFSSPGNTEGFVMRLDSSGNMMWFETFGDSVANIFYDVTVRADNSILVTGQTFYSQSSTIECSSVVVLDLSGSVVWSKKFTVISAQSKTNAVVALPGGSVILAGQTDAGLNCNASLMRITPGGTIGWSKSVNPLGGDDLFNDVCYAGGKRCAAVGASNTVGAGDYDVLLTLFDTTGVHKRTRTFGTPHTDYGYSIMPCTDGGFTITGITENVWAPGQFDPFILRTDSLGNQLWLKVLGTAYPDVFSAMNDADNGALVLCGFTQGLGQVTNQAAYIAVVDSLGGSDCFSIPAQFQTDSIISYSNSTGSFAVFGFVLNFRTISSQAVTTVETYPWCSTRIDQGQESTSILIYPQPATTELVISGLPIGLQEVRIYSADGALMHTQQLARNDTLFELNVREWTAGLYVAVFNSGDEISCTKKFIVGYR